MDRQSEHKELKTISMIVFVFTCTMASLGICLAFMFLCFNVRNRHRRYVQQGFIGLKGRSRYFAIYDKCRLQSDMQTCTSNSLNNTSFNPVLSRGQCSPLKKWKPGTSVGAHSIMGSFRSARAFVFTFVLP